MRHIKRFLVVALLSLCLVAQLEMPRWLAPRPVAQVLGPAPEDTPEIPEAPPVLRRPPALAGPYVVYLRFVGSVDMPSATKMRAYLAAADEAGADRVVVELNTPGGGVAAGQELTRSLERTRARVFCVVDGEASSMGFYILQGCRFRAMTSRSTLMVHEPLYFDGAKGWTEVDFQNFARDLHVTAEAMLTFETSRLTVPRSFVEQRIAHSQKLFLGPQEALKIGAVDAVVGSVEEVVARLRLP